jgi:hypothetical protein
MFLKKFNFFYLKLLLFYVFKFYLFSDVKNNFLKIKKIYYFDVFHILNRNHCRVSKTM